MDERGEDEVDGVVAAWQQERPDLVLTPLEVLSRVTRLARTVDHARRAAFSAHEVETWEFDVLAALRRAGEPHQLSPGQLSRQTHVTSGTMTNRISRLASRGLVEREADPSDGRAALVTLTPSGRAVVDAAITDLLEREEVMLTDLSERDRAELADLLRRLTLALGRPAT